MENLILCTFVLIIAAVNGEDPKCEDIDKNNICTNLYEKGVVEGGSTNVDIRCNLDSSNEPLYWEIQHEIYHVSNLPYIFKTTGYQSDLTLETINRRMDGWEILCLRVTSNNELIRDTITTVLRVAYDINGPDPGTSSSLEPSNRGIIILNYQDMRIGVNETFISWFYDPDYDSPCAESRYYRMDLYNRTGSGDIRYLNSTYSVNESVTINSSLLYSQNEDTLIYFNVSALANDSNITCATTEYLQTLSGLGTHNRKVIFANGNSTSINIPAEFNASSLQLIWPTEYTQCVSPLVEELIDFSFCNGKNNTLSLFNNTITISNLEGMNYLALYVVNSTLLISCCNIRQIERIYRVYLKGSGPEELTIEYDRDNREFCIYYHSTSDPEYPIAYRANITGVTGHVWTSEKMVTPQCNPIPAEFHSNVLCHPFNITLYLTDSFEEEIQREQLEFNLENITVLIDNSSITTNSTNITINCYNISTHNTIKLNLTLKQDGKVVSQNTTDCNTTVHYNGLQSGTNYTLLINREFYEDISCELYQDWFKTKADEHQDGGPPLRYILAGSGVGGVLLLVAIIIGASFGVYKYRRRNGEQRGQGSLIINHE